MAKTFKEIHIYGAPSFPQKETSIRAMDCQFNGEKENREAPLHVTRDLVLLAVKIAKASTAAVSAAGGGVLFFLLCSIGE
jgi:hypothetical protein